MTPELQLVLLDRARALQMRLNHGRVDPVTAASEARRLFEDAGAAIQTRWLNLELHGYGLVEAMPLHVVLGVPVGDRLAAHVTAYRSQPGLRRQQGDLRGVRFRHFFVESLSDLVAARASVALSPHQPGTVELEFNTSGGVLPQFGIFSVELFDRIVGGFVAALHLQLGGPWT